MHQGAGATTESSALELSDTDIENLLLLEPKGYCRHCHEKEMDKRTESLLETLQDALSVSLSYSSLSTRALSLSTMMMMMTMMMRVVCKIV